MWKPIEVLKIINDKLHYNNTKIYFMKTAEEILLAQDHDPEMLDYAKTIDAINEARREIILELADETYIADDNFNKVITRKEILKKLDELK